jgi:hypothetical protein
MMMASQNSEIHDVSDTLRVVRWLPSRALELRRRPAEILGFTLTEAEQKLLVEFFIPRRGDPVDEFLKRWCDKFAKARCSWLLDQVLDDYRLHADTGVKLSEEVEDPYETKMLPGPYRIDPNDGNAYRVDSENDYDVWVTDIFGTHHTRVPKSEWMTWNEVEEAK